ncbi:hypothetical protein BMETH_234_1 [methanotrophic bacterial endosymbiont of Bathymodiolus sp.]|nr:hypothetical protein BMETH_234_1 [methanotrophic bacterial endosymbiont of Bathymodiolus sp.]
MKMNKNSGNRVIFFSDNHLRNRVFYQTTPSLLLL